jgi:hypothetical protein
MELMQQAEVQEHCVHDTPAPLLVHASPTGIERPTPHHPAPPAPLGSRNTGIPWCWGTTQIQIRTQIRTQIQIQNPDSLGVVSHQVAQGIHIAQQPVRQRGLAQGGGGALLAALQLGLQVGLCGGGGYVLGGGGVRSRQVSR